MVRAQMRDLRRSMTGASRTNFPPPPGEDPAPFVAALETDAAEGVCLHQASGTPRFQYTVPQSLYGTVLFMPVLVHESTLTERIRWHGLSYFWMCVNYISQTAFLFGIHHFTKALHEIEADPECEQLQPWLLASALFACTVAVLTDVQETYDLSYLVNKCVPTVPETSMLLFKRNYRENKVDLVGGGFSARRKTAIHIFVLFPKFLLAAGLLYVSFKFLVKSEENMDIILNATALVFVIETPESLFAFFSLPEVRTIMSALPDFDASESKRMVLRPLYQLSKFIAAIALVIGVVEWDYDFEQCTRPRPRQLLAAWF
mmetsp:Transcript_102646/g.287672  ORF Transcript_102646/g.287672 Transcript_102646/m.287672 type:complete len:316 (+) Transcript_102646:101-1048(+)